MFCLKKYFAIFIAFCQFTNVNQVEQYPSNEDYIPTSGGKLWYKQDGNQPSPIEAWVIV